MYTLKVDAGEVEKGLVMIPVISIIIYWPLFTPDADKGFEYLIRYPVPSSEIKVQGVVVGIAVFTALLQLLVSTAVLTKIGLGMNKFNEPPMSM